VEERLQNVLLTLTKKMLCHRDPGHARRAHSPQRARRQRTRRHGSRAQSAFEKIA